jgi:glucose-6-phosphate isomerase
VEAIKPFFTVVDFESGSFEPADRSERRYLSDLKGFFYFSEELEKAMERDNSLVYEVHRREVPLQAGHLQHCVTLIHPGDVGGEFYMTKGHYHRVTRTAELYLCLCGEGILNMEEPGGAATHIRMRRGVWSYIAPGWAHRTINISRDEKLIFISVWPGDSGYDYRTIAQKGFSNVFVRAENKEFSILRRS